MASGTCISDQGLLQCQQSEYQLWHICIYLGEARAFSVVLLSTVKVVWKEKAHASIKGLYFNAANQSYSTIVVVPKLWDQVFNPER